MFADLRELRHNCVGRRDSANINVINLTHIKDIYVLSRITKKDYTQSRRAISEYSYDNLTKLSRKHNFIIRSSLSLSEYVADKT